MVQYSSYWLGMDVNEVNKVLCIAGAWSQSEVKFLNVFDCKTYDQGVINKST